MKLRLLLRPEAEVDVSLAYRWYDDQLKGLGRRFVNSLGKIFYSIQTHPTRFPIVHKNIRRVLLGRFPYGIFFVQEGEAIIVIAILHQARDPRRWKIRYTPRSKHT